MRYQLTFTFDDDYKSFSEASRMGEILAAIIHANAGLQQKEIDWSVIVIENDNDKDKENEREQND